MTSDSSSLNKCFTNFCYRQWHALSRPVSVIVLIFKQKLSSYGIYWLMEYVFVCSALIKWPSNNWNKPNKIKLIPCSVTNMFDVRIADTFNVCACVCESSATKFHLYAIICCNSNFANGKRFFDFLFVDRNWNFQLSIANTTRGPKFSRFECWTLCLCSIRSVKKKKQTHLVSEVLS